MLHLGGLRVELLRVGWRNLSAHIVGIRLHLGLDYTIGAHVVAVPHVPMGVVRVRRHLRVLHLRVGVACPHMHSWSHSHWHIGVLVEW